MSRTLPSGGMHHTAKSRLAWRVAGAPYPTLASPPSPSQRRRKTHAPGGAAARALTPQMARRPRSARRTYVPSCARHLSRQPWRWLPPVGRANPQRHPGRRRERRARRRHLYSSHARSTSLPPTSGAKLRVGPTGALR
eukprot:scaffold84178_cov30-Tisochrysis_lutea.AAC.2